VSEAGERPRRLEPPVTDTSEPFWEATRRRRLLMQWCVDCGHAVFFPRDVCPRCLGSRLEWRPSAGTGSVHTYTVEHNPQNPNLTAPYTIALIDLDDGVRMMSNVVGCPPDEVRVGMRVAVTWEELSDGRNLPLFEPAGPTPGASSPSVV
jgi:uncharacterized OB-fold protein